MTHDALNDGEQRQLPVRLTNLWRPVLIDRPLLFIRPADAHPLARVYRCLSAPSAESKEALGVLARLVARPQGAADAVGGTTTPTCALLHIADQNPVASSVTRYTVALILVMVLAGVPVRAVDTGPTRAAQVCTIEDKSHPRPLWFAKVNLTARGCPYTVTTPK